MGIDGTKMRDALGKFPTGVCVVTVPNGAGGWTGVTVSSFNSVSLDPPLILWSLAKTSQLCVTFRDAKGYVVNVLAEDCENLARQFASNGRDDNTNVKVQDAGKYGVRIQEALVSFDCGKYNIVEAGDHYVLISEVMEIHQWRDSGPLCFNRGRFQSLSDLEDMRSATA